MIETLSQTKLRIQTALKELEDESLFQDNDIKVKTPTSKSWKYNDKNCLVDL